MSRASIAEKLRDSLISSIDMANELESLEVAGRCLEQRAPAGQLVKSISEAFGVIGSKYEKGVYYLPELMFAGVVGQKVLDILSPILRQGKLSEAKGTVVIGTVRGDIHDLGKNIVTLMLRPEGFMVIDLGTDVPPQRFAESAATEKAGILCMSALLSTTRGEMKTVIQELEKRGLRGKLKIIIGGGAVDQAYAQEVGADAYGKDAVEAVRLCKSLIGR
ncbi:MAG: cobalamin-dependent protein [Promethearchaeati archaeon SRVP18_Atabeyarchaeia-1]